MSNKIDRTAEIRNRFLSMGISAEVVKRINAYNVIAADGTIFSEVMEMGYPVTKAGATRLKLSRISGMSEGGLEKMFQMQESIATFLDGGMRATPLLKRLALPLWVEAKSSAKTQEDLMARAKGLVRGVVQGQVAKAA